MKERFREDKKNRLTRRAKIASNYLSAQAIEVTQENIENRKVNQKAAMKRNEKIQEELNELNAKSNKTKKPKKHKGNFKFY